MWNILLDDEDDAVAYAGLLIQGAFEVIHLAFEGRPGLGVSHDLGLVFLVDANKLKVLGSEARLDRVGIKHLALKVVGKRLETRQLSI